MTQRAAPALSRTRLCDGDVQDLKPEGWWGDDGKLFRVFTFDSYRQSIDFVLRVAELAEAQNHHPDMLVTYQRVKVNYFTHDMGGVTAFDLRGAQGVNDLYALLQGDADALPQAGSPGPLEEE